MIFLYSILYYYIKKVFFFSAFFISAFLLFLSTAECQSDDREIMQMFYREDELVVSATRHSQPISQVAENMTVVSSQEIEAMNAHTVAEVLERIPGIFISFNHDFGAASLLNIQGSEQRHVLVLLDGFPLNLLSEGSAETNTVPTGIIDRIEIIKGPASSAWGSSLGGVVNIITKATGHTNIPSGSLSASYGRANSQDLRAEASGMAGRAGYYLFAGRRDSDGLRDERYSESNSLFGKLRFPVFGVGVLDLTMGYSEPETLLGRHKSVGMDSEVTGRNFFATASLDIPLQQGLSMHCLLYNLQQKNKQSNMYHNPVEEDDRVYSNISIDEYSWGVSSRLVWEKRIHTAVLGMDFRNGRLKQTIHSGKLLQATGAPETLSARPDENRWAAYVNDTMLIGKWSITPGIRYDRNSISGSFLSPSLGMTCALRHDLLLRLSIARGFTSPSLTSTTIGGLFNQPNPSLDPEKVWSYQAGIESGILKYAMLNITLFHHDVKDAISKERIAPLKTVLKNKQEVKRTGIECEAATTPFHNISLLGGYSYVHISPSLSTGSEDMYSWNVGIQYNDRHSLNIELSGKYLWWDIDNSFNARYDDFIWDFNLSKKIPMPGKTSTEFFCTLHNMFNSSQYAIGDTKNPGRWFEAGMRFSF